MAGLYWVAVYETDGPKRAAGGTTPGGSDYEADADDIERAFEALTPVIRRCGGIRRTGSLHRTTMPMSSRTTC